MTRTRQSIEKWTRLNRLLLTVLPVNGIGDLLIRLSEGWRDLTNAQAALVSVRCPGKNRLEGCFSREGMASRPVVGEFAETAEWCADDVLRAFGDQVPKADQPAEIVPITDGENSLGGVILFSGPGQSIDTTAVAELTALSARLILQAMVVEEMVSAEDDRDRLERAKLEALGEFAAGAGHEINNPLAAIGGRVQLLLGDEADPAKRQALKTIGGQVYRIRDMIGDLMLFARPPQPQPALLDVAETLAEALAPLEVEAKLRGCHFDVRATESVPIWADRVQLAVVISSLVRNSLDAVEGGGPITITARAIEQAGRRLALLAVTDRGRGLSDLDCEHLFDPFYAGKQAGRGLGFGLSKCWRIVSNHGGRIQVESTPGEETTFTVFWPAEPTEHSE